MQKIIVQNILYFSLLLCSLYSWGQDSTVDRSNNQLLWEISGNGLERASYLFGTFHTNDPAVFEFSDSVYWAILNSEAIVLETDITSMMGQIDVLQPNFFNVVPRGLRWLLPTVNRNNETRTQYGTDSGRPQFIDLYFKDLGDGCEKPFFPLESLEDQMNVGVNLKPSAAGRKYRNPTEEELKVAYLIGDIQELHDLTKRSTLNFEGLYEELITDRNFVMADGLDTLMHQHSVFCGVGAAHLGGKFGIIRILQKKGYKLRPIKATFTESKNKFLNQLEACKTYYYEDLTYGYRIPFGGKPNITQESDGIQSVDYQELGQGNSYSVVTSHAETFTDARKMAFAYFAGKHNEISFLDSSYLPDGTPYFQAKITKYNEQYWLRSFFRNDILYLLYASGGHRFMNSNRPNAFFEQFEFIEKSPSSDLVELHTSPIGTMEIMLPKNALIEIKENFDEHSWRSKWFNPVTSENFYAFESFLTNNSMYFKSGKFGEYLLSEFHEDSIWIDGVKDFDNFMEKNFFAEQKGRKVWGKIRLMGNILQFVQYSGTDETQRDAFLASFTTIASFSPLPEIDNSHPDFSVTISKKGVERIPDEYPVGHRNLKHYVAHDYKNAASFEIYFKEAKPWAYAELSDRALLTQQVNWKDTTVPQKVDTVFHLNDSIPWMEFEIQYPNAKNCYAGKVFLTGKRLVTIAMYYPLPAKEVYSKHPFISSFKFTEVPKNTIQIVDTEALQNARNHPSERKNVVAFFEKPFTTSKTALRLLFTLDSLDNSRATKWSFSSPRTALAQHLTASELSDSVFNYWKENAIKSENRFTETFLNLFLLSSDSTNYFEEAMRWAINFSISLENPEQLIRTGLEFPAQISSFMPYLTNKALEKPNASASFFNLLEEGLDNGAIVSFIQSNQFEEYCLKQNQELWVSLRYFQLIKNYHSALWELIDFWGEKNVTNPEIQGIRLAWKEILNKKLTKKEKASISKDIFTSIGYAKVMSLNNAHAVNRFSFEETLGLLAFDYYKDNFRDPNKSVAYITTTTIPSFNGDKSYAIYNGIENGVSFYFARLIDAQKILPTIHEFGNDVLFLPSNNAASKKELIEILKDQVIENGEI